MKIGVPKEIKPQENRVGLNPANTQVLTTHGHQVFIENNAGFSSSFTNEDYAKAGAIIINSAEEIFATTDLIIKVKEPQPQECKMLRKGQAIFTYLHLAPDPKQTKLLLESQAIAIAYETVTDSYHSLPLLAPMSAIAGRLAVQAGARCLEKSTGGKGILLSGVHGTIPARVVIIGGGIVGVNAARMAIGLEANVTILDTSLTRIQQLDDMYTPKLKALYSIKSIIEEHLLRADLVIGSVLIPGAAAPKIITEEMVKSMKEKSVLVDVAIDQGGCCATSKPTTHKDPTYIKHDIIHYCVMNMPSNVARTATFSLNNATLKLIMSIAENGCETALKKDRHLRNGLNIYYDKVTNKGVADSLNYQYHSPDSVLGLL
ncbi:MAG: alanine dehydrogenase [Rickettsiaceae bacterium H1]|nr:alanine dehydrogenase [Rickettsiaceae bacterium H1]